VKSHLTFVCAAQMSDTPVSVSAAASAATAALTSRPPSMDEEKDETREKKEKETKTGDGGGVKSRFGDFAETAIVRAVKESGWGSERETNFRCYDPIEDHSGYSPIPLYVKDVVRSLWTNVGYEGLKRKRQPRAADYEAARGVLEVVHPGKQLWAIIKNPARFDEVDKSALVAELKVTFSDLVLLKDAETEKIKGRPSWVYAMRLYAYRYSKIDTKEEGESDEKKEVVPYICRLDIPVRLKTIDPFRVVLENTLAHGAKGWWDDVVGTHNSRRVIHSNHPSSNSEFATTVFRDVPVIHPMLWTNKQLMKEANGGKPLPSKPDREMVTLIPSEEMSPGWNEKSHKPKETAYDQSFSDDKPKSKKEEKKTKKVTKRKAAAEVADDEDGDDDDVVNGDNENTDSDSESDDRDKGTKKTKSKSKPKSKPKPKAKNKKDTKRKPAKRLRNSKNADSDASDGEEKNMASAAAAAGLMTAANGVKWAREYGAAIDGNDAKLVTDLLKRHESSFLGEVNVATNDICSAGLDLIAYNYASSEPKVPADSKGLGAVAVRVFTIAQFLCHELNATNDRFAKMNNGAGIHPTQLPAWVRLMIEDKAGLMDPDIRRQVDAAVPLMVAATRVAMGHSRFIHPATLPVEHQRNLEWGVTFDTRCSYGGLHANVLRMSKLFFGDDSNSRWADVWRPTPTGNEGIGAKGFQAPPSPPPPQTHAAATPEAVSAGGGGGGGGGGGETLAPARKVPPRQHARLTADNVRKLANASRRTTKLLEEADPTAKKIEAEKVQKERALEKSIRENMAEEQKKKEEAAELLMLVQQRQLSAMKADLQPSPSSASASASSGDGEQEKDKDGDVDMNPKDEKTAPEPEPASQAE
jgi:hypothetical protein